MTRDIKFIIERANKAIAARNTGDVCWCSRHYDKLFTDTPGDFHADLEAIAVHAAALAPEAPAELPTSESVEDARVELRNFFKAKANKLHSQGLHDFGRWLDDWCEEAVPRFEWNGWYMRQQKLKASPPPAPPAEASEPAGGSVPQHNLLVRSIVPILLKYGVPAGTELHPATQIASYIQSVITAATTELRAEIERLKAELAAANAKLESIAVITNPETRLCTNKEPPELKAKGETNASN